MANESVHMYLAVCACKCQADLGLARIYLLHETIGSERCIITKTCPNKLEGFLERSQRDQKVQMIFLPFFRPIKSRHSQILKNYRSPAHHEPYVAKKLNRG